MLERRPDIRQAEQLLHAAGAQVGVAVGGFFPKIGLTALFGQVSQELSALTAPGSRLWSAGADASGPLFQAGIVYGRYRQSRAAWNEAKLVYEETVLDAQQQLFPQENALAQTELNQLLIIVRLYKALGGGWNQPETPAPAK